MLLLVDAEALVVAEGDQGVLPRLQAFAQRGARDVGLLPCLRGDADERECWRPSKNGYVTIGNRFERCLRNHALG
jgi:hypothetical protein